MSGIQPDKTGRYAVPIFIMVLLFFYVFFFIPKWLGSICTKIDRAYVEIELIKEALEMFYKDNGRYPSTDEGLELLINKKNRYRSPYLDVVKKDPWGNAYHYCSPGIRNKAPYDLWSYGADNSPGGQGDNADITNWERKH